VILINKTENGLVGDVAFDEVSKVAKALLHYGVK
jgi:5,10-methylene-tetrahydrofolate dehydrogenase/methenyl tetrahydrofolate cyclohydrolase